ncbi:MAG: protoporphyrinogen oxidase-like protein [bacterium]|nr:protoporphyrinogen oxidase-like protein [bacterium]
MTHSCIILGAGITGLAAGFVSEAPIYEAAEIPGGICASYYLRPETKERLFSPPEDGDAYRFEIGGGHWIFGGDPAIVQCMEHLVAMTPHERRSSVYFRERDLYVPYPLQNHLRYLGNDIATQVLAEIAAPGQPFRTMQEWLESNFGFTLCRHFFFPFHERYTAGLYPRIAPQDAYKSPVNLQQVIQGAFQNVSPVGYNTTFLYPQADLSHLARQMAQHCTIEYEKRVVGVDVYSKQVSFADGSNVTYSTLISTLPLNRMLEMTKLATDSEPAPYTSVFVLNIGALKGTACPDDQWLYNPDARSGFHRVGFYSHVDASFLPRSTRETQNRVAIYVERAYKAGKKPTEQETQNYCNAVVQELQDWKYIQDVEVVHPTWVEIAYTWALPGSHWKERALQALQEHDIYQVGRYGRWAFQGIADSLRDGFIVGASLRNYAERR